jgi:3-oxoacyl-[acyl-carrier protein] reductase
MEVSDTRVALVSGGSRGIGAATVLRMARDGFDISFCYRSDEAAAEQVAKQAAQFGVRVLAVRADVADPAAVGGWMSRTEEEVGPVDVAITCAGITRDRPLALMSDEQWDQVLGTNLTGVFQVCRAAAFGMLKRRRGSIVTLSSVSGLYGNSAQTNYSAAKAGIIGFSKALAKEVGRHGIRVNTVAPGLIETDMTAALSERSRARLLDSIPLGRLGHADEVAELIAYLASSRSAYVTGSVFEIHGGITI